MTADASGTGVVWGSHLPLRRKWLYLVFKSIVPNYPFTHDYPEINGGSSQKYFEWY